MIRVGLVIGIFVGLFGCGSVTPDAVDAAGDFGGRGGSGGQGGNAGSAADASGDGCAPPAFSCLGAQGGCATGEEAATRTVCGVAVAVCCPVNVCDPAQCHACTGCP
jgi:hypothetical protein